MLRTKLLELKNARRLRTKLFILREILTIKSELEDISAIVDIIAKYYKIVNQEGIQPLIESVDYAINTSNARLNSDETAELKKRLDLNIRNGQSNGSLIREIAFDVCFGDQDRFALFTSKIRSDENLKKTWSAMVRAYKPENGETPTGLIEIAEKLKEGEKSYYDWLTEPEEYVESPQSSKSRHSSDGSTTCRSSDLLEEESQSSVIPRKSFTKSLDEERAASAVKRFHYLIS